MSRLRQVARSETDDRVARAMYDLVFAQGVDPLDGSAHPTDTGSRGDWWTTFALVPDVLEHAVAGFVLYRSPQRRLDPVLRELALARIGWAVGSAFVYSQPVQALRAELADEEILKLTYVGALYVQHAVMSCALRLEWDDRPDPVTTVAPPDGFDAARFATTGADPSARAQFDRLRGGR